jgi:tetratricopeptide (TPR) repeat protein
MALDFYERLTRERSIDPRIRALALRRLGFTRMVYQRDTGAEADFRQSIDIYGTLLKHDPRDADLRDGLADAYYNLGILQYSLGRMTRAEPWFRKAIEIREARATESPMEPQNLEVLAGHRAMVSAWKAQDALAEGDERKRRASLDEAEQERRALLDDFRRLTRAAASLAPASEHARWAAGAYRSLARLMADNGWTREQEEAIRCGLAFEPDHPDLLLDLASLLAFRRESDRAALDEAVGLAKKAAESRPESPEYWRVLALAHLRAHDVRSATQDIEHSLRLQPPDGRASDQLVLAMISSQRGHPDDARTWYVRALDRRARSPNDDPDAPKYWSEARVMLKPILVAEHLCTDHDR